MFITLNRSSFSNGKTMGHACRVVLRKEISRMRRIRRSRKIPERLLDVRIRDFTRHVRRVAPHWIDEAKGMAVGAGVPVDDILKLNCLPAEICLLGGSDCTTFVSVGKDENRLFKIRDPRNSPQAFFITQTRGQIGYHCGNTIGSLGAGHVFNSYAVAGACNTGSPTTYVADEPRLNDRHLLRFMAENARSVDEVPGLFERLLENNVVGGAGPDKGTILVFADGNRGLILESHCHDYAAVFVDRGTRVRTNHFSTKKANAWISEEPNKNTRLRRKRMTQLLARHRNRPSPIDVFAISRDRKSHPHSLCNDDKKHFWMTTSAQLQCISRKAPETSMNYICCGNTRNSLYLPVPLTFTESFEPLVSGQFYLSTDTLYRKYGCSRYLRRTQNTFERRALTRTDTRQVFADAYRLIRGADPDGRSSHGGR